MACESCEKELKGLSSAEKQEIISLAKKFNSNQIAAMKLIRKEVVEAVLCNCMDKEGNYIEEEVVVKPKKRKIKKQIKDDII
tara:strand:+ start:882 stop:1127 length:246 start_codon:yes stop_codon:yes gene_type:complete